MHSSLFTYYISRPYPYRWFTPVVTVGGIIATVLFSLLNFASNGFYLSTESVTDPNVTLSSNSWMNKWPSYFTHQIETSCQPHDIQVNSQFFTNQTGLTYTLKSVWQQPKNGTTNITSSITYLNNEFQNCSINTIQVDFEAEDRTSTQYAWRRWGLNVMAFITCSVETESGIVYFSLTSEYNLVSPTAGFPNGPSASLYSFLNINNQTKASLWWGQSLLSVYWAASSLKLERDQDDSLDEDPRKGTIYLMRNDSNTKDITDLAFFDVDFRFLGHATPANGLGAMLPNFQPSDVNGSTLSIYNLDRFNRSPNVWIYTDSLGKSMYSAVMTDLGQKQQPNILLNATALQHFTANFSQIADSGVNVNVGPAQDSFSKLQGETGPLGTSPAVVFTKYLCQVPKRKSFGSLFVSILIADLVFLQALWTLFNLAVGRFLDHNNPEAKYCQGCMEQRRQSGSLQVIDENTATGVDQASFPARKRKGSASYIELQQLPAL